MAYQIKIKDEMDNLQTITIAEDDQSTSDRESYGALEDRAIAKLKDIHSAIRAYSRYAIGAFQNLPGVEVDEVTLKFGIAIEGTTGIPILTGGSAGANFEIEVKCKPKSTKEDG
ncbi:MAG: CU044_2847 family protein [Prochlorotrichaceae cyanobacterium]|jgi:hypothetical protein